MCKYDNEAVSVKRAKDRRVSNELKSFIETDCSLNVH